MQGCGGSTAAGAGSAMSKDPEDFHLDPLHFKKMDVSAAQAYHWLSALHQPRAGSTGYVTGS